MNDTPNPTPATADHPARAASQASMAAVTAGDRAAWLALFAADACQRSRDQIGIARGIARSLLHRAAAIAAPTASPRSTTRSSVPMW